MVTQSETTSHYFFLPVNSMGGWGGTTTHYSAYSTQKLKTRITSLNITIDYSKHTKNIETRPSTQSTCENSLHVGHKTKSTPHLVGI